MTDNTPPKPDAPAPKAVKYGERGCYGRHAYGGKATPEPTTEVSPATQDSKEKNSK